MPVTWSPVVRQAAPIAAGARAGHTRPSWRPPAGTPTNAPPAATEPDRASAQAPPPRGSWPRNACGPASWLAARRARRAQTIHLPTGETAPASAAPERSRFAFAASHLDQRSHTLPLADFLLEPAWSKAKPVTRSAKPIVLSTSYLRAIYGTPPAVQASTTPTLRATARSWSTAATNPASSPCRSMWTAAVLSAAASAVSSAP